MNYTNDDRKQIILGSLLGNGYICKARKNAYFCMRHSTKHYDWLKTKANELQEFASKTPFYEYHTTVTWRSQCHPLFSDLRDEVYKDDMKCVTMEWLDQLRALAIAVWFGDSGSVTGRGKRNACLRTQPFGPEGNEIIERYFNEVGLDCNLNKSRKSQVIVFTVEGTQKLYEMIANCLPSPRTLELLPGIIQ